MITLPQCGPLASNHPSESSACSSSQIPTSLVIYNRHARAGRLRSSRHIAGTQSVHARDAIRCKPFAGAPPRHLLRHGSVQIGLSVAMCVCPASGLGGLKDRSNYLGRTQNLRAPVCSVSQPPARNSFLQKSSITSTWSLSPRRRSKTQNANHVSSDHYHHIQCPRRRCASRIGSWSHASSVLGRARLRSLGSVPITRESGEVCAGRTLENTRALGGA